MSFTKKRPTFLRLMMVLLLGLLVSGGILMVVQRFYQSQFEKSALREPFFILAGVSTLLIALLLLFPANKPARLFKWFWRLVILAVLVAVLWGAGAVYIAQNDILYMPGRRELTAEDALRQVPAIEEISLPFGQETAHGYFWKSSPAKSGLILYFGGNGELAAGRLYDLIRLNAGSLMTGYHFMMVDYPGYGQSTGEPTEQGIYQMAQAAYDYALGRAEVDPGRVVVAGWSLGTGAASHLAAANQPAGLVLMAPFVNGKELAFDFIGERLPTQGIVRGALSILVRNRFSNDDNAKKTQTPALIIAGRSDTVIPFRQAEKLAAFYPNARLITLEGGHTAPWVDPVSLQALGAFLAERGGGLRLVPAIP